MRSVNTKKRLTKSQITARREKIVSFIVLAIAAFLFVFPLIYMLGTSFKSELDLQTHPEKIFPTPGQWTLKHYTGFFITASGELDNMPKWMFNSIWSTAATVGLTLLTDLIVAYVVVFLRWKGKKVFMKLLFAWMAAPTVIGTAPGLMIFQTVKNALGANTPAGTYMLVYFWLVVPGITGVFNVILMNNFFRTIPVDIIESAKSDGASHFKIFTKIVCPLAKSTMMVIVLFTFAASWNNLQGPQLLMAGEGQAIQTITVALAESYGGSSAWGAQGVSMATAVFSLIPVLIIFIFTQNKMIEGLASTGVKG